MVIVTVEFDDIVKFGPEERAVGEHATADDRITAIVSLTNDPFANAGWVVQDFHSTGRIKSQIVVMDKGKVPEAHLMGHSIYETADFVQSLCFANCAEKSVRKRNGRRCLQPEAVWLHVLTSCPPYTAAIGPHPSEFPR